MILTIPAAAAFVGAAAGLPSCLPHHVPSTLPAAPKLHAPAAGSFALPIIGAVDIPGAAVRFEGMTLDTATNRLFLAHTDADQLVAVDIRANAVVGVVNDIQRVHGVLVSTEVPRLYAGGTAHDEITVIDPRTLTVLAHADSAGYPVAIAYAPNPRRVIIANGEGTSALVLDPLSNEIIARIPLGASAADVVYDPVSACVLMTAADQLMVLDPETDSIAARITLPGVLGAHAIALDVARRVAFVTSQANAKVAIVDLADDRLTGTMPVGRAPDGLAFDPGWGRLYVGSETGTVSTFTEIPTSGAGAVILAHEGDVIIPHGHTLAVDPRTHRLYLPLENDGGRPRLLITAPRPPG
jgi:DNA-binding beta-propeller fold protein YncE